ncbi:GNAT family N-acetyltransferase [Cellvibrio fontiphilus]|uniref:GNAT family N-acetyltransferase n=1 Tax=Cellvibrio fontiphilus TaxID=1815559 RepID=A0ABV7FJ87_9GAMM
MLRRLVLPGAISLRRATENDSDFAEALFVSTREHFYQLPLAPQQIDGLLKQQYQLQQVSYCANFPAAQLYIIEILNQPIGKLLVDISDSYLRLIDFVLLKEKRSKGYGSAILRSLKDLAQQEKLRVQLSVDQQNIGAKKLYLNLGFSVIESSATHDLLCW